MSEQGYDGYDDVHVDGHVHALWRKQTDQLPHHIRLNGTRIMKVGSIGFPTLFCIFELEARDALAFQISI